MTTYDATANFHPATNVHLPPPQREIPRSYNLQALAKRILKQDCRLLLLGEASVAPESVNSLAHALSVNLAADNFVGRMAPAVPVTAYGISCGTGMLNVGFTNTQILCTGTSNYGVSGSFLKTVSDIRITGAVGAGVVIFDTTITSGQTYAALNGKWYSGTEVYARPIYYNISGANLLMNNGKLAVFGGPTSDSTTIVAATTVALTGTSPIGYFDQRCVPTGRNRVSLQYTTPLSSVTGRLLTYYGTLFYVSGATGLQVDGLGTSGWTVDYHQRDSVMTSGIILNYMTATRNPNTFLILLGQYDSNWNDGTWYSRVSGMVNFYRGLCSINSISSPLFLLCPTWKTAALTGQFKSEAADLIRLCRTSGDMAFLDLQQLMGESEKWVSARGFFDANEVSGITSDAAGHGIHLSASGYDYLAYQINRELYGAARTRLYSRSTKATISGIYNGGFYRNDTSDGGGLGNKVPHLNPVPLQTGGYQYLTTYAITASGEGYPITDPYGGVPMKRTLQIDAKPLQKPVVGRQSYQIVQGLGDTSTGSGYQDQSVRKFYFFQKK